MDGRKISSFEFTEPDSSFERLRKIAGGFQRKVWRDGNFR